MKLFGLKEVKINGYPVYTYNLLIKSTSHNLILAKASGLDFVDNVGRNSDKIQFTFTTMNSKEFNDKTNMLGHLCRAVALNNLNSKYNRWVK
jgi:hypothetical protein